MCTRKDLEEVASQMVEKFKEQLLIDLKDEFTKIVDSKFNDLKTEIAEIRKENQHLKECIASANEARDELEQYGRRSMLEIHDEEKANALNNYFSSISNVNDSSSTLPRSNLKTNYCLNELTINEQEVIDILENLDVNKSTRPDQINEEKANALNNYFSSISNVNDSSSTLPRSNLKTNYCLNELTINEQEVIDILENLDVNKSTRPDQISQRMLKETSKRCAFPLYALQSFDKYLGLSKIWKLAHGKPAQAYYLVRGYRDHEGGSPGRGPPIGTSVGLTPAIATNVGYSEY
ncbi:hypothetical protein MAR_016588 [Mya arenaria]|uniref:Uncharacterized protein n=1 Tax=Mya arenaria TaxID=6604 RepID=A0ABY7FNA2_MYAAR|nr:hypothetical protein MAR_016588 [Mya arenaria]